MAGPRPDFSPSTADPPQAHAEYAIDTIHDATMCGGEMILKGIFDPEFAEALADMLHEAVRHWRYAQANNTGDVVVAREWRNELRLIVGRPGYAQ